MRVANFTVRCRPPLGSQRPAPRYSSTCPPWLRLLRTLRQRWAALCWSFRSGWRSSAPKAASTIRGWTCHWRSVRSSWWIKGTRFWQGKPARSGYVLLLGGCGAAPGRCHQHRLLLTRILYWLLGGLHDWCRSIVVCSPAWCNSHDNSCGHSNRANTIFSAKGETK